MVNTHLDGRLLMCGCSAASGAAFAAAPSASADATKRRYHGFATTGNSTNVWPLSPQDWSTG
jgi:hypothetical protein